MDNFFFTNLHPVFMKSFNVAALLRAFGSTPKSNTQCSEYRTLSTYSRQNHTIKHNASRKHFYIHKHVEREKLTSVLAGDEIDPVAQLDFQVTVTHEVLQTDLLDYPRLIVVRVTGWFCESPRIFHCVVSRVL